MNSFAKAAPTEFPVLINSAAEVTFTDFPVFLMHHFAITIVALWEVRLVSGVLVIRGQVVVVVYWLVYLLVWLVLLVFIVVFLW